MVIYNQTLSVTDLAFLFVAQIYRNRMAQKRRASPFLDFRVVVDLPEQTLVDHEPDRLHFHSLVGASRCVKETETAGRRAFLTRRAGRDADAPSSASRRDPCRRWRGFREARLRRDLAVSFAVLSRL